MFGTTNVRASNAENYAVSELLWILKPRAKIMAEISLNNIKINYRYTISY